MLGDRLLQTLAVAQQVDGPWHKEELRKNVGYCLEQREYNVIGMLYWNGNILIWIVQWAVVTTESVGPATA
jgi:hypothetical protein